MYEISSSHQEYILCVQGPCQHKHAHQIECVQRCAPQFAIGNYHSQNRGCVSNMVTQLVWDLLEHRRIRHRITMFYKILNNIVDIAVCADRFF